MRWVLIWQLLMLAVATVGTFGAPAAAQLYRWVDERGVVNYGDTPPDNARQITLLSPDRSGVSVVPGLTKDELERTRNSADQARIERLEREVAQLREDSRTAKAAAPAPAEATDYYPAYYDYPIRRPRPPNHGLPGTMPYPRPLEPAPVPAPPVYTRKR